MKACDVATSSAVPAVPGSDVSSAETAGGVPAAGTVHVPQMESIVMVQVTDAYGGVICSCVKSREDLSGASCMHDTPAWATAGNPISRLWTRVFGQ